MKKLLSLTFISIMMVGCSDEKDLADHEKKIEALEKENQELKDKLSEDRADYNGFLQETDRTSRRFMDLLAAEDFETLKAEFPVKFEVKNNAIHLAEPEGNLPFEVELAKQSKHIGFFNKFDDMTEISYYMYNPQHDSNSLVVFHYDKDNQLEYVSLGGR
ncbi:hypothetical protein MKY09_05735 [Psychrobacillus sp. FSL K6-4046]|uniref:hypothetical protein n=1 Tax=Psychrobacillus sp. FSL K6-4046 TaxID=2921550 RepID=UPI00315A931F